MTQPRFTLFGRTGSHYTRLVRIVAYEAGVDLPLRSVSDMTSQDPADYGGHPGLKMPTLIDGDERVFGSLQICRRIAAASPTGLNVVWPETQPTDLRSAWELLDQAMQAQVQLVFGVIICGLPRDHVYFHKARQGLEGILVWLEARLAELLATESAGDLSVFQAQLFCLLEHMRFRPTLEPKPLPRLEALRQVFAERSSARMTPYGIDHSRVVMAPPRPGNSPSAHAGLPQ